MALIKCDSAEQRKQTYNADQIEIIYEHVKIKPGTTDMQGTKEILALKAFIRTEAPVSP